MNTDTDDIPAELLEGLNEPVSAGEAPDLANTISQQGMDAANKKPSMEDPPIGHVTLPGGWVDHEGNLQTTAMVRELTGRDEERLARIDPTQNLPLFLQTMARCGVETLGTHEPTDQDLEDLLVGDREALILGIRIATYGRLLPMHIICPNCGVEEDLELELDVDIPVRSMETPEVRRYDHTLRDGRHCIITPATARVQDEVWDTKLNAAELKTRTIAMCIQEIEGRPATIETARSLGLADRKSILERLSDLQPGPDYGGVRLPCEACGMTFALTVDLADLFR